MASQYYHEYQEHQNHDGMPPSSENLGGDELDRSGSTSSPVPAPAPALISESNRNVSFNQAQASHPNPTSNPNPTSSSSPSSSIRNSTNFITSPTTSLHNQPPPSTLNRNFGTLASRETKQTEKTNLTSTTSTSATTAVALNFWDSLVPSRFAGVYLGIILVEAIVVITMVAIVFGMIEAKVPTQSQELKTVPVYLAIFLFGMIFEVLFALDAARLKNTIQCIGVCIFNIALIVTASLEITQVRDALRAQDRISNFRYSCDESIRNSSPNKVCDLSNTLYPEVEKYLVVVPVIVGLAQIPITILTWRLHMDFGWLIYKKLGADLKIRNMFLWYQVLVVLLKFCFFFGTGFSIAYLILIADRDDWGFGVTIAAIPLAIAALILAAIAVKREIKWLMLFSILLFIAGLTYFAYKLSRMYSPSTSQQYVHVKLTLTFFSIFSIVSLLLTTINSLICFKNFGNGLKEAHKKPNRDTAKTISKRRQVGRAFRGTSVQSFNGLENLNQNPNGSLNASGYANGNGLVKNTILEDEDEEDEIMSTSHSGAHSVTSGSGNGNGNAAMGSHDLEMKQHNIRNSQGHGHGISQMLDLKNGRRESNPMGIGINNGQNNASRLSLD